MCGLMAVLFSDGFADQSRQLTLSYIAFMEYQAEDDDPIDRVHLRQAPVDLLLKDPVSNIFLHAVWVGYIFADTLQCIHGDGITAASVRTICTITHTDVPSRCIAFASPLELLPLLPEWTHDVAEFFMGQRRSGRITRQVVGLLSTWIYFV